MPRSGDPGLNDTVKAAPLAAHVIEWMAQHPEETAHSLALRAGTNHAVVEDLERGRKDEINVCTADRLLMATEGFLALMYPIDDPIRIG